MSEGGKPALRHSDDRKHSDGSDGQDPLGVVAEPDDGDATLGDLMANGDGTPEDHVMTLVDSDLLDELLGTLDTRARYAVEARFGLLDGERKSFREVGEQLGVTAEAARRLVSRAVVGLRDDAERILAV